MNKSILKEIREAILYLDIAPNHDPFCKNHQGSLHNKPKLCTSKGKSHKMNIYTYLSCSPHYNMGGDLIW